VVAQRLVRTICPNCKAPHTPTIQELAWLRRELGEAAEGVPLWQGKGCTDCNKTGYKGRTGVYEFMKMTLPLVEALGSNEANAFSRAARASIGKNTLRGDACQLALQGKTSVAEAMGISAQVDG
jgi:MSHA biogenesis protein MshE